MVTVSIGTGTGKKPVKRRAQGGQTSYARLAKARKSGQARAHYTTVARTRGVYAQGEMKYFDSERAVQALTAPQDWTGTEHDPNTTQEGSPVTAIQGLFTPKPGTAINQRIARQAQVFKIKIRGNFQFVKQSGTSAGDNAAYIRYILVQDTQSNSTQMQGEDLMADPTTATALAAINSFQDLKNFGRFKVLKDKTMVLQDPNFGIGSTTTTNLQNGRIVPFKISVNFKEPVVVRFNAGTAGTFADIVDNSFHMIAMCSSIDLSPQIMYTCRVCFKG